MAKVKLTNKEATELVEIIEKAGGDARLLREALNNGEQQEQANSETFIKLKWDAAEHSKGFCVLCHQENKLAAGVCPNCFRAWALSCKPKKGR